MDVIALALAGSVVLMGVAQKPRWIEGVSRTMAIAAGLGALLIVVLPHTGGILKTVLQRIPMPGGIRNRLLRLAEQVLLGLRAFHNWGRLAEFVVLTVVIWVVDAFGAIAGARALGFSISFRIALLLLTGLVLGSALPATPGYVGIYQFVAVTVLTPFGVSRDEALAYILVAQALGYVAVLGFGVPGVYRLQGGVPVPPANTAAL